MLGADLPWPFPYGASYFMQAPKAWGTVIPIRAITSLVLSNAKVFIGHLNKQGKWLPEEKEQLIISFMQH